LNVTERAEHIRSHLVPRCYLKRFADDREQVKVYERDRNVAPYMAGISNVAAQRDFYMIETPQGASQEIERRLSEIDGQSCDALKRLGNDVWPLSTSDRDWLANFIALQVTRGTQFRDMQHRIANEGLQLLARAYASRPESIRALLGEKATDEAVGEAASFLREGRFTVTPRQTASVVGAMQAAAQLVQPIGMMRRHLLRAAVPSIATSDAPLTLWREPSELDDVVGIGVLTAEEIALPVDPWHALILLRRQSAQDHRGTGKIDAPRVKGDTGKIDPHR
jgi:Protein of unknown function (DUF4238)